MNYCKNIRVKDPSGNWDYEQLIGAKVKIKSMPVSNFFQSCKTSSGESIHIISEISFRVSIDGKAITVIELEDLPGKIFTWKDLEIVELDTSIMYSPVCGTFKVGTAVCGYKVDNTPSYLSDMYGGGIAIVDESGNIISDRLIRFNGAEVESIIDDNDGVTDINFNGEILD